MICQCCSSRKLRFAVKAVAIAAVIFMLVQIVLIISMGRGEGARSQSKIISRSSHMQKERSQNVATPKGKEMNNVQKTTDAYDFHPRNIAVNKYKKAHNDDKQIEVKQENKAFNRNSTIRVDKVEHEIKSVPRGVLLSHASQYISDATGYFTCLHSKEKIDASKINDNFCDCTDFTDEPGTNACSPHGRFYCTFQVSEANPLSVWSGRVNDGICDCCDGSDEWESDHPDHLPNGEDFSIYQSPCSDHCQELRAELDHKQAVQAMGAKIKQQYIESGLLAKGELYGFDGAFYQLSQSCYHFQLSKYSYEVCPFQKVTQSEGSEVVTIGKDPQWLIYQPGNYLLLMDNGSSRLCPHGARKSRIKFECALQDGVVRIEEAEVCSYLIHFDTPAAC